MKKIVELFYTFSEFFISYILNSAFSLIFTMPLILAGLLLTIPVTKVALVFIPLAALYPMAIKNLTYSAYNIVLKNRKYYGLYFFKSAKNNFFRNYIYYLITTALLYSAVVSCLILVSSVSPFFWALLGLIIVLLIPHMVFTTMQFALYEGVDTRTILQNSFVLSFMYAPLSLALTIITVFLAIMFKTHTFKVMLLGVPIFALAVLYIWKNISENLKINEGSING